MDVLDVLKKDWQKGSSDFPKLTYDDIYKMILKKSSSIVKWIFIISLLEFIFWLIISFALKDNKSVARFDSYNADYLIIPLTIISYIVLAYFFIQFYKNYKKIAVTDSAILLMERILKTRQTVKHYVAFNLLFSIAAVTVVLIVEFDQDQDLINLVNAAAANNETLQFYVTFALTIVIGLLILIGLLLLFYWLIYGILLRRLNRNYAELKKLDL